MQLHLELRKGYQINFWAVLHSNFNESTFQLSVFSTPLSTAQTHAAAASHAHEFLMSQLSASASELKKPLAWQGLTISGRLWKRSAGQQDCCWWEASCWTWVQELWETQKQQGSDGNSSKGISFRYWSRTKTRIRSSRHSAKPHSWERIDISRKTPLPSKFDLLHHPQVRMSH